MEILEPTGRVAPRIEPNWDLWLAYDGKPRRLARGVDFTEECRVFKRKLITEAAIRGFDITARIQSNERVLYQIFSPTQEIPELPDLGDARKKYPWHLWLDGQPHQIVRGRDFDTDKDTFKQHAYKTAEAKGLKVKIEWENDTATIEARKVTA